MDKNYERLLHLLRCGIEEEDLYLPHFVNKDTDWEYIFLEAKKQTVLGIVLDGMAHLPKEFLPERNLYLKWCSIVGHIEKNNEWMNKVLCELLERLEKEKVNPVLLKGQGAATRYPFPEHRMCGDIDLYVEKEDFERAKELFESWQGVKQESAEEKHMGYRYQGVIVELHHVVNRMSDPRNNRRLKKVIETCSPDGFRKITITGRTVSILPVELDAFYMLTHVYYHMLEGGIALRQLCDWVMLVKNERKQMDISRFLSYLKQFHFRGMYGAMAYIAVKYLGLKKEMLPITLQEKDSKNGEKMMELVMERGNFGHYEKNKLRTFQPGLIRNLKNYIRAYHSCIRFFSFCPREAIWFPIRKLRFYLEKI